MRGRHIDRSGPDWWYNLDPNQVALDGKNGHLHKTHHENADGGGYLGSGWPSARNRRRVF